MGQGGRGDGVYLCGMEGEDVVIGEHVGPSQSHRGGAGVGDTQRALLRRLDWQQWAHSHPYTHTTVATACTTPAARVAAWSRCCCCCCGSRGCC